MMNKIIAVTFLTFALLTTGYSQGVDKATLDQFLDRLEDKQKAMGSLHIAKDANKLYTRSIGYSAIKGKEKKQLAADTKYRVGSVTKTFTAVLVFQLIEEGKLKLEDNIFKFFPETHDANKITIAHLLGHRSGIPDITENPDFRKRRFDLISKDEMVSLITKPKPAFEPGSKYSYSSSGYYLLGIIIEKLTGKPYQDVLRERINARAGLVNTYTGIGNIDAAKNESYSYRYTRNWELQPETNMSILFGSGNLISTVADQARFIESLFNNKLISQGSLNLMMQDTLGLMKFNYNGKDSYGHTGGIDGFGSWLVYVPEDKLVVSYATNGKVYPVKKIIDGIFDIYYNKPFTIPSFENVEISTETLDKYVGVYFIPGTPAQFTVTREGNTLLVQPPNQDAFPMEATAENKFKIESAGIEIEFDVANKQMIQRKAGKERILSKQ